MNDLFSPRELEVLKLLCKGLTHKEIAKALCVSYKTVQTHLMHIYEKLNAKSNIQAVRIALLECIITLEDLKNDNRTNSFNDSEF